MEEGLELTLPLTHSVSSPTISLREPEREWTEHPTGSWWRPPSLSHPVTSSQHPNHSKPAQPHTCRPPWPLRQPCQQRQRNSKEQQEIARNESSPSTADRDPGVRQRTAFSWAAGFETRGWSSCILAIKSPWRGEQWPCPPQARAPLSC